MIYHITTGSDWEQAQQDGAYHTPSLQTEGFIHCSSREQIIKVANAFYRDLPDLVLLCIETDYLEADLKWEDPAHPNPDAPPPTADSEKFPHVYGEINLNAVVRVVDFPAGEDGMFSLPPDLLG